MALLAETKEWRGMAAELAEGCGLHYIPVEEALVQKVCVGADKALSSESWTQKMGRVAPDIIRMDAKGEGFAY